MQYDWVLARYHSTNETGKKVVELANAGVGYHIINKDRGKSEDVIVAFKHVAINGLPHHLTYATKQQSEKLEKLDMKRKGGSDREDRRTAVTSRQATPQKVNFREVFTN